jgi:Xaa-Pro dipeptidase
MKVSGLDKAVVQKDLAFPVNEFQRRLDTVRREIAKRGIDLLVISIPENIYYLSGYHTAGYQAIQFMLVPSDGEPCLLTRGIEETNVKAYSWIDRSASYMDHESPVDLLVETIRTMGYASSAIGIEKTSWFLTIAYYERIKERLQNAKLEDGSMIVEGARAVKSELEIDYIRQAARLAEAGMEAGINQIHAGANENDIAAEIQRAVTSMGSEYPGTAPFVATGVRTSYAHATWSGRKVLEGDPVLLELSGTVRRYSAALMRAIVVKPASREIQRMEEVSRNALENMLEAIRPGRPLGEVWDVWSKTVTEGGFEGRFKRTGYSIGVNFPPDWGEGHILSFKRGETQALRPNMTFHIPSIIKVFGFADVGTSETIRVTDSGCEILTNFKRQLYVR